MPCLNLSTNVRAWMDSTPPPSFPRPPRQSPNLSESPKLAQGIHTHVIWGNQQPTAFGELVSIGGLNPDVNKKLSAAISAILEDKLSVPKNRFFLKFYDSKASDFGWNGSTY